MQFSNSMMNRVGEIIRQGKHDAEYTEAIDVLNAWREAHGPVLDEYYDACVELGEKIGDEDIIVAQRLKRLPTIIGKLSRFEKMKLSIMQDIAGVRMIVGDMDEYREAEKVINSWPNLVRVHDYVENPKPSGYRSKHYIFKKDGMFVEIQLRTDLQHLWATSVETTDVFRGASLKEHIDDTYWQAFFSQVSCLFAFFESTPIMEKYRDLDIVEIRDLLVQNMKDNRIGAQIESFSLIHAMIDRAQARGAYYAVIELNFQKRIASATGYKESDYDSAFKKYQELESNNQKKQVVLVGVSKIRKLQDAYPNYFLNLNSFLRIIKALIASFRKIR